MAYKLDKYRKEAQGEPFVLEVDDKRSIVIEPPTVEDIIEIGETPLNNGRRMLQLICGEQFDEVWELISQDPGSMLVPLVVDMAKHFKINTMSQVPGGFVALPR